MARFGTAAVASAVAWLLMSASASAAINGTYKGENSNGNTITVNIAGNKLVSVSSITVTTLDCELFTSTGGTVPDGTEAAAFPVNTTPFGEPGIDTVGGEPVGGSFDFGDNKEGELAQGDTASGGSVRISQNGSSLSYLFTLVTDRTPANPADGPATRRRTCTGGETIDITLAKAADSRKSVKLDAPRGLKDTKVLVPPLAQIGDQGLTVTYGSARKDGKLEVDVRLAKGSDDPFRIGNKSLGDGSGKVKEGKRGKVSVPVKSTLGPPDEDDVVKLEITLTYKGDGVKARPTESVVRVPT